ncbi:DNA-directed RNA polymerase subunit beta' [Frankliniella fusca]|uniref:DNA-directed RNA polymerase subunit beta n=1 Tax=Frankliniella fusca TaxID=407009 RepID=A0AAE1I431_9NEOP|nr:DNA-directed RNA polymerase subunit beta' [Frankliniella fusca]
MALVSTEELSDTESCNSIASDISHSERQIVSGGVEIQEGLHSDISSIGEACEGVTVDNVPSDSDSEGQDSLPRSGGDTDNSTTSDVNIGAPSIFNSIIKELSNGIDSDFSVSKGELLLMTLSAHQQNRWTNKSLSPIVPGTQFLVDKLLFNEDAAGITRHFFCYNCGKDFGTLHNVSEVLCENPRCKALNLAANHKKWRYYVSFDVVPQLEALLNKNGVMEHLVNPKERIDQNCESTIRDVYDGEMYKNFVNKFCVSNDIRYLSFTLNTDGIALYSSSNGSIWLILLMLNELPPVLRMQNLLIGGLWFGNDHPIMDLFLSSIVKQLNKLSNTFQLKIHRNLMDFQAFLIAACVDSGARGSVQGIATHSGFFSCNWCLVPGFYNGDKVVFPITIPTPQLRTHAQLFEDSKNALTLRVPASLSSLEKAELTHGARFVCEFFHLNSNSFDCVNGFVVDALHALDHGVARQCMKIWSDSESEHHFITPAKELTLDTYVDMLKPPVEVRKFPRKISDRAIYILSRKEISVANLDIADALLVKFIQKFQDDYSHTNMSFNVHLVLHACKTVKNWGPLWAVSSAYAFEAGNGDVKKLLHSAHGAANQVCRNLSHRICRSLLEHHFSSNQTKSYELSIQPKKPMKKCVSAGSTHFLKSPLPFTPIPEEEYLCEELNIDPSDCMIYMKVIKDNMLIKSTCSRRSNNCVFETIDDKIVRFTKLLFDSKKREGYGFCHELLCNSVIRLPSGLGPLAPKDECVRKVITSSAELRLIPLTNVRMVCCLTELPHGRSSESNHNSMIAI